MKSLILLTFVAAAVSFAVGTEYNEAIQEINEAFPGLVTGTPEIIKVVYENGNFLDLGKNITPTESINKPTVDWTADADSFYALAVSDPDAPSRANPYLREVPAWVLGNIPGKDLNAESVVVIFDYIGVAPPKRYGPNRYFFFVFKQNGKVQYNEPHYSLNTAEGRTMFSLQNFTNKYNLGSPVGVNYLTGYYDPQTDVLYKSLNCCEDLMD